MPYIHEDPEWPNLRWDDGRLLSLLAEIRHRQGRLLGRMEGLGFRLRAEASLTHLTADVTQSSAIEGERLDAAQVRSSIARRLGLDFGGEVKASRDVEGVVEMMLDATQKYAEPLTAERLFGWHAALFSTGRSGMRRIAVGEWRPASVGPMQVVSGRSPTWHWRGRKARRNGFTACPRRSRPRKNNTISNWSKARKVGWISLRGWSGFWPVWGGPSRTRNPGCPRFSIRLEPGSASIAGCRSTNGSARSSTACWTDSRASFPPRNTPSWRNAPPIPLCGTSSFCLMAARVRRR